MRLINPTKLPSPLEEIATDFAKSVSMRITQANVAEQPTDILFHYTNESALSEIIGTNLFWLTSIYHMDDPNELSFGVNVCRSIFKSLSKSGSQFAKIFCEPFLEKGFVNELKAAVEFYSFSFGKKDDEQQWEDYADNGRGISFGLAPSFFRPANIERPKPEDYIFVGKVAYGEKSANSRHATVIRSAIEIIDRAFRLGTIKGGLEAQAFFRRMAAEMYVELTWNCVTTKSEDWSHQNEIRLLALNRLKQPHLKIHNSLARPRVEIPQPLLRRSLREILVGPKSDAGMEERVCKLLQTYGIPEVEVKRSAH